MNPKDISESLSPEKEPSVVRNSRAQKIGYYVGFVFFTVLLFLSTFFSYNWLAPDFHLPKLGFFKFLAFSWLIYFLFGRRFGGSSSKRED